MAKKRDLIHDHASASAENAGVPAWAEATPEFGRAVYRLTNGPRHCKHYYHTECPFSADGRFVVFMRYEPGVPEAEICVLELASGHVHVVGEAIGWSDHTCAGQHWQGERPRIVYQTERDGVNTFISIRPDGNDEQVCACDRALHNTSRDGRYSFARNTMRQFWPADTVADRSDRGVWRLDHDTESLELVASLEAMLALHPLRDRIGHCHLMAVQIVTHASQARVVFVMNNAVFRQGAGEEPFIKCLYTMDEDGSELTYLGSFGDHPIWHPTENLVLSNMPRYPHGGSSYCLFPGDGIGPVRPIPGLLGGGHPSFHPDGRFILTDRYRSVNGERRMQVLVGDLETGEERVLADLPNPGHRKAYHHAIQSRAAGTYLVDAISAANTCHPPLVTQSHPAWNRDGKLILFNGDPEGPSELHLIDFDAAWNGEA